MDKITARKEIEARWKELYPIDKSGKGIICPLCGCGSKQNEEGISEASGTKHHLLRCRNPECFFSRSGGSVIALFMREQGVKHFRNAVTILAEKLNIKIYEEWELSTKAFNDFSSVQIHQDYYDFESPADYFKLSDYLADKLSKKGESESLIESPSLSSFRLEIYGNLHQDSQIGSMLRNVNRYREEAEPYGLFARFLSLSARTFYVAMTVCLTDKDWAFEMPVAVLEIGQNFFIPICVNERAVDHYTGYFTFDDIKNLAIWLRNFWCGVQFEMINRPEEIRIIEQKESFLWNSETYQDKDHIVFVKHVIPIDENGNVIRYKSSGSGRDYHTSVWGVRGHPRTLPNGRITMVRPYFKGKNRSNPNALREKEYCFVEEKKE